MKTFTVTTRNRREAGFNLMEVLVALGLFALGFAAIATVFPAGALLQRQTADDIRSRHTAQNAKAVIAATPLPTTGELDFYYTNPPNGTPPASNNFRRELVEFPMPELEDDFWPWENRSFPTTDGDPNFDDRDFYWIPLIRDVNGEAGNSDWELIVFVLRRQDNREYPYFDYPEDHSLAVPSLARYSLDATTPVDGDTYNVDINAGDDLRDWLRANDYVVDNAGGIYRIADVEADAITVRGRIATVEQEDSGGGSPVTLPNTIWFAPASPTGRNDRSPAQTVFRVENWGG